METGRHSPQSIECRRKCRLPYSRRGQKTDVSGNLKAGIPLCPPEGDAGTGMVATNAVKQRTGNVSAGTSSFSMIVLEKELSKPYEMIDMVTTPDGSLVCHGTLQQLYFRPQRMGQPFQGVPRTSGPAPSIWTTYTASFTTTHSQAIRIAVDSYPTIISLANLLPDLPKADLYLSAPANDKSTWPTL